MISVSKARIKDWDKTKQETKKGRKQGVKNDNGGYC